VSGPLSEVVQDYADLGRDLLDRWTDRVGKVAGKIDDGTYDADSAAADLAATVCLAAETGFELAAEVIDAIAILAGPYQQGPVCSIVFHSPVAGAPLALTGPLVNGFGDVLPVGSVTFQPAQPAAGDTAFRVCADALGRPAGAYRGTVEARPPGAAAQPVPVWIAVP
jgi:hypothetical protein